MSLFWDTPIYTILNDFIFIWIIRIGPNIF